jgi:hypothetical protein
MGCDFYICVYLKIEHQQGISYCALPSIRGYYCDSLGTGHYNSDDEFSDDEEESEIDKQFKFVYNEMKKLCLTPRLPFVIYEDGKFISTKVEQKYLPFVLKKLNGKNKQNEYCKYKDTGKLESVDKIIKITKMETRYDPYNE